MHFGVVSAVNMSIGTLTPPVGIVMFVICQIADLTVEAYTRATLGCKKSRSRSFNVS